MREKISATLKQVELQAECSVLFACESGSRAWGFASPDSDYDVRFIYTHPLEWYLRLENRKDTIDEMLPDDIDLGGWEFQKMLRLFHGCNPALNEWIGSPVVYLNNHELREALIELIPAYFNPKKALFHYLNMASKASEDLNASGEIRIKKLFYILRPLLACHWINQFGTMPPTAFKDMLERNLLPEPVLKAIQQLLLEKEVAVEGQRVVVPQEINQWTDETQQQMEEIAKQTKPSSSAGWLPLNGLVKRFVLSKMSSTIQN